MIYMYSICSTLKKLLAVFVYMYHKVDIFTVFRLDQITNMIGGEKKRLKTRKLFDVTSEQLLGSLHKPIHLY